MSQFRHNQGMTLIEILITLTIGLFILAGVIQVMSGQRATYTSQESQSRQQENLRYSMNLFTENFQEAGYGSYDCTGLGNAIETVDPVAMTTQDDKYDNTTEAITLRRYVDEAGDANEEWDDFNVNCAALTQSTYYIRSENEAGDNIPSLYLWQVDADGNETTAEVVEGIQNLSFEFGIDIDNDSVPNRYISGDDINGVNSNEWANVVTIRFWVTARTMESINGSFYEQTLGSTVMLRNRS